MKTSVVITSITDSQKAGKELGQQILSQFDGKSPDVVVVFSSSKHNYTELLKALKKSSKTKLLVGCSSAGEFVSDAQAEGAVSALAITSSTLKFSIGVGKNLNSNIENAAEEIYHTFKGNSLKYQYKSALILADALAGYTDELIDKLNQLTAGTYQFFGGGAGDDAKFYETYVFYDTKAYTNAVVSLEILSNKPFGIGVRHGWEKASDPMRVTESDGMRLISLNATSAVEVFKEHAKKTNQKFDLSDPIPFFLHNTLGIKTVNGYKLRVPLTINKDGSINCASDIPKGALVSIMQTTSESASHAAKGAIEEALLQLQGHKPGVALFFDCVATRLRTGSQFANELETLQKGLGTTRYVGCNTYGQIARVDGQFSGFHNCTAVVCVIPE